MTNNYFGDLHSITTADGNTLYFPDQDYRFLVYGGYGAPPVEYQTRRGYKQDGATEIGYTLAPRSISVQLWRAPACSRIQYWNNRALLHEFLRPNRGGPITFTLERTDGTKRSLTVRANSGLAFAPAPDDNSWQIDEPLEFIANDPVWFNPSSTVVAASNTADTELIFPIDFPIWFGGGSGIYSKQITYNGSWKSYPTLTLTGPYTLATIENIQLGVAIYLTVAIATGARRIITLGFGNIGITDESGNSKIGELGPDSNLIDFVIAPDPEVAGGVQTIRATFVEPAVTTAFTITYNERYFAI